MLKSTERLLKIEEETDRKHMLLLDEIKKIKIKEMSEEEVNDFIRNVYDNNLELNQKYFDKYGK